MGDIPFKITIITQSDKKEWCIWDYIQSGSVTNYWCVGNDAKVLMEMASKINNTEQKDMYHIPEYIDMIQVKFHKLRQAVLPFCNIKRCATVIEYYQCRMF